MKILRLILPGGEDAIDLMRMITLALGILISLPLVTTPFLVILPFLLGALLLGLIHDSCGIVCFMIKLANPFNEIINPVAQYYAEEYHLSRNAVLVLGSCYAVLFTLGVVL